MYIHGFHIDGFGVYCDQGVQDLPQGLVLFIGDNEAGKTTLMEFCRTVLFGWPRKPRNDYPPLRGGNHGGRLVLAGGDGRQITIQRLGRQATIAAAGRAPQPGEPSKLLLKGLDRATFEHIFAIGLGDLHGLDILKYEGVRGLIISAGAGLGAASVPGALKSIDGELGRLWAPRSTKLLNQLSNRLRTIDRDIKQLQGQAAAYAASQRQKEELEARAAAERGEAEALRRRLRRLEQLEQAREPWAVLLTASQRAGELDRVKDFPPNGLEHLEHLNSDLEKIRIDLLDREGEASRLEERLQQIAVDEALLAQREALEALFGEREKIATSASQLPTLRHSLQQAEEDLQRRLRDLGADWDAPRLDRVETSVAVRQLVQDFGHRLDLLERRAEQLRAQVRFLEDEAEEARERLAEACRRLSAMPAPAIKDTVDLREKQENVRLLRALLHRREMVESQHQDRRLRQEDAAARLAVIQEQLAVVYDPIPWWIGLSVAMTGLALDAVVSVHVSHLAGNLIFLGGLVLTGVTFLVRRRLLNLEGSRRAQIEEEARRVEERVQTLAGEMADLEAETAALDKDQETASLQVADALVQDVPHLERLTADLEQTAERLQAWRALEQHTAQAEEHYRDCRGRLEKARQETAQAAQEVENLQAEWRHWLATHGFSEAVCPTAFEAVLQAVERAREALGKVEENRLRLSETGAYLEDAYNRIQAVLTGCNRTLQSVVASVNDLDALRRALFATLESRREQRELQNTLAASQEQAAHLKGLWQAKRQELERLLDQAGAADEDDFRRLAMLHQDWRECARRIEQSDIALLNIAGNPEAQRDLREELRQADVLSLQGEQEELAARLGFLETSIPQADQEVGRLQEQLSRMAQDDKLGNLLQEESILEEQLQHAMQRWVVLALARHLVEVARGVYELERQPQVIREADRFLGLMTGDRYRLVSSLGDESVQLEDRSLKRKDQIHWSDGLADQVYLSVRLGLAREFSRHAEPLPVILDDVLVKFDPRRRRGAARVILEFARDQQVLLFTCHPEFQKIIASLHQEDYLQVTPVSYFRITDGMIQSGGRPES